MGVLTEKIEAANAVGIANLTDKGVSVGEDATTYEIMSAIGSINTNEELPEEAFRITGDCRYRFAYNGWDWFVNIYKNMITTKDISNGVSMFNRCDLQNIPFDLNFNSNVNVDVNSMFNSAMKLTNIPKLNNLKISASNAIFSDCQSLVELSEESIKGIDWSYVESVTSAYTGSRANTFFGCYKLRRFPMSFLNHGNLVGAYNNSIYYQAFTTCQALDEIIGLPFPHKNATWTSSAFSMMIDNCYRLKEFTFAVQEDGSPYVCKWSKQTIDFSKSAGYGSVAPTLVGISPDKEVKDDATYQALKNDPDWYTKIEAYSRYNHDSAVNTINSLPDVSSGASNTIKFKGAAGSKTDGGAINTLTDEEIAVAAAKGWTISLA